jgi:hypothetical protein
MHKIWGQYGTSKYEKSSHELGSISFIKEKQLGFRRVQIGNTKHGSAYKTNEVLGMWNVTPSCTGGMLLDMASSMIPATDSWFHFNHHTSCFEFPNPPNHLQPQAASAMSSWRTSQYKWKVKKRSRGLSDSAISHTRYISFNEQMNLIVRQVLITNKVWR